MSTLISHFSLGAMNFPRSVLLLLLYVPLGRAQGDAHLYSPGTNLERNEMAMLKTATRSVDVARYSFTDREIAEELVNLARKGVRVRVYRDRTQFQEEGRSEGVTSTSILLAAGNRLRISWKGSERCESCAALSTEASLRGSDRR